MPRPAHHVPAAPAGVAANRVALRRAGATVVIGLAFALRLAGSVDRPLWFDEGYSIYFAGVAPLETAQLTAIDIHPPGYYWSLQLWTLLIGWNELSVRVFSVALGTLTVALLLACGVRAFGWRTGGLAAAALALSPLHLSYSFEVRMYALLTLLALVATWAWWRLSSWRAMALYSGVMAAALLTQYYAGFLFAAHALTVPLFRQTGRRLAALGLASLPFGLWAAYAGPKLAAYVQTKVAAEAYPPLDPLAFFGGFGAAALGGGTLGAIGALILAVLAVAGMTRPLRPLTLLLAGAVALPLVLGYFVNLLYPFNPPGWQRLFLFILPPWLLLAAQGAVRLVGRPAKRPAAALVGGAAAAVVMAASLAGSLAALGQRPTDDPRPMIRQIERLALPSDLYLAIYPWQVGYLRLYDRRPLPEIRLAPADQWALDPFRLQQELVAWSEGRRVWLPAYQRLGRQLEIRLERAFGEDLFLIAADWFGDHRLLFARSASSHEERARDVRFGDFALVRARIEALPVESGAGAAAVEILWAGPHDAATVHLRLADARGITWAQHDGALGRDQRATRDRRAVLVPPGTPPGRYRLLLALSHGDRALSAIRSGAPPAPELDLGEIEVVRPTTPVSATSLAIGRPQRATIAPTLELLGSDFGSGPYQLGDSVLVSLYWLPLAEGNHPEVTLRVGGAATTGAIPASRPGEPVREIREVVVRESGRLPVLLQTASRAVHLGEIEVRERERRDDASPPATRLDVRFGDGIRLVGATVAGRGGAVLPLGKLEREMDVDLIWRAEAPVEEDLAVFVHLVGADGRPVAQHDGRPANGAAPTRGWRPGETVIDRHRLVLPPELAGDFAIVVGLYRPPAGPRLPAASGESVVVHRGGLP